MRRPWGWSKRTHAGAVDVDLLRLGRVLVVEEQLAVLEGEGGRVVGLAVAGGALLALRVVDEDVALGGGEAAEVDGRRRAQRHEVEGLDVGRASLEGGSGRGADGEEGGDGGVLHLEGVCVELRVGVGR